MRIFRKIGDKLFYRGGIFHPTKPFSLKWQNDLETAIREGKKIINIGAGPYQRPGTISIDPGYRREDKWHIKAFGENLPFKDNSIDFAICSAVLQYIKEPIRVVDEIYRILKPGGRIYTDIVFLFPSSSSALRGYNDYNRMTLDGLECLCRKFKRIESGAGLGVNSAIARILVEYGQIFFRNRFLKKIARNITKIIVSPLKYFDRLLVNNKEMINLAGGVYFYGEKR